MTARSPISECRIVTSGPIEQSLADADVGPYHRANADQRASADFGVRSDHRERINGHPGLKPGRRMHLGARSAMLGIEQGRRSQHLREELTGDRDEGRVRTLRRAAEYDAAQTQ